jgi:hypothetical protein
MTSVVPHQNAKGLVLLSLPVVLCRPLAVVMLKLAVTVIATMTLSSLLIATVQLNTNNNNNIIIINSSINKIVTVLLRRCVMLDTLMNRIMPLTTLANNNNNSRTMECMDVNIRMLANTKDTTIKKEWGFSI